MSDQKPKVLCIVPLPPPFHGAAMQSRMVVESSYLNERYYLKTVPMRFAKELDDIGKFSIKKPLKMVILAFRLVMELILIRPHLVYYVPTHQGYSFYRDFLYVCIIKCFRRRIVFHQRNKGARGSESGVIQRKLRRIMYRNTDSMILSPLLRYDIEEYCDEGRIHVVPNGMPDIPMPCVEPESPIPSILFLSNLIAEKGVWVLMEALSLLKQKGVKFRAVYAGDSSYNVTEKDFRLRLRQLDLEDRVRWVGFVDGKRKLELICESDILTFPTFMKHETFGNVVLEAMRASKPVVVTGEGSLPFIVEEGVTGLICEKKDAEDLAVKLDDLLRDPQLRIRMGIAARERFLEYFTFSIFEQNFDAVLQRLLGNSLSA